MLKKIGVNNKISSIYNNIDLLFINIELYDFMKKNLLFEWRTFFVALFLSTALSVLKPFK